MLFNTPLSLTAYFFNLVSSAKIKNIIFTEEAKAKLLAEQRNKKKDHGTSFVPTNIAVNYVQHNRCEFSDLLKFEWIVWSHVVVKILRGKLI